MLTRRQFLASATAAGSMLGTMPVAFATVPGDKRLVVIILRGGMDGMELLPPYGDPNYAKLRPTLSRPLTGDGHPLQLDDLFGLHPEAEPLKSMYGDGDLGFVHSVASPYRHRSHFDGQDILENGTNSAVGASDGWLNRSLKFMDERGSVSVPEQFAMSIGRGSMLIMRGDTPAGSWSPDAHANLTEDSKQFLQILYSRDKLFHDQFNALVSLSEQTLLSDRGKRARPVHLAKTVAQMLKPNDGARIASFAITGWDTHKGQQNGFKKPLKSLMRALTALKEGLGDTWKDTAVLAMTEFGRTAYENGTKGTDHGTASTMILAGGAVNGGKVYGDWAGLSEGALYQGRDLMPQDDVRRIAAWALKGLFGVPNSALTTHVFPGLELGRDPECFDI